MKVKLKFGIGDLLFGMKQKDVESILGKPNKHYIDEEDNIVYIYNDHKLRLTFYDEEELRFGYLTCSSFDLELFGLKIIGKSWDEVNQVLKENKLIHFETEIVDGTENYFFEDYWLFVNVDYNQVYKIELGAVFNSKDEFDWKF